MKNTLYSLMLNEEIVEKVDLLAVNMGMTRSSLINEILAEYVDYVTPTKRARDILGTIEQLMLPTELIPFITPNSRTISIKSSLQYRYRPTIKYEVSLFRTGGEILGQLDVLFRTQSSELVSEIIDFFRIWKRIENKPGIEYELYGGKFTRTILMPEVNCTSEELANSITALISFFDKALKGYLSGRMSEGEIEREYNEKKGEFLI